MYAYTCRVVNKQTIQTRLVSSLMKPYSKSITLAELLVSQNSCCIVLAELLVSARSQNSLYKSITLLDIKNKSLKFWISKILKLMSKEKFVSFLL